MNNHTIGSLIQYYRKLKKLSQQDLAKQLNISRQAISRWELDQSHPDLETMKKLAEIFDISVNDLMGVENQNEPLSEIYDQIQSVLKHIQSSNRQRNILQVILILVCVISLSLTVMMKVQIDKQNEYLSRNGPINPTSHTDLLESNLHEFSSDLLLMDNTDLYRWPKVASYMDVSTYDLDQNTVTLDYRFILKEYQEKTSMSVQFTSDNTSFILPLEKETSNIFTTKQSIPLDDYIVDLLIQHEDSTIIERLEKECALYLDYVIKSHILLSIPSNGNGGLDLTKIEYSNGLSRALPTAVFIGQLEGTFYVNFQFENNDKIETVLFSFEEPSIKTCKQPFPTNEEIYISISYVTDQISFRDTGLIGTFNKDITGHTFIISDENVKLDSYMICHGS